MVTDEEYDLTIILSAPREIRSETTKGILVIPLESNCRSLTTFTMAVSVLCNGWKLDSSFSNRIFFLKGGNEPEILTNFAFLIFFCVGYTECMDHSDY